MNSGALKTSLLLLLLPLIVGAVKVENFWKVKEDNLVRIHGSWEWVESYAGVTNYRIYPENGQKRILEAIKSRVMVFNEEGRILTSGEILNDTVALVMNDGVQLRNTYEVRNDSLFIRESGRLNSGAHPVLSVYVRMK